MVTRPQTERSGVLFLAELRDLSFHQKVQTVCGAHTAPSSMGIGGYLSEDKAAAGMKFHVVPRLSMIPLLSPVSSWHGQAQLYLLHFLMNTKK
jgi:hypothetical protein